jgi:hypothetical protein
MFWLFGGKWQRSKALQQYAEAAIAMPARNHRKVKKVR